jgi:glycogen operon protein
VLDDSFVLCFNAHREPIEFILPPAEFGDCWRVADAHSAVVLQAVAETTE